MINRMVDPSSGAVIVDGATCGASTRSAAARHRYVIQSGGLMPHQRVIDNVATVPVLTGHPAGAAAAYEVLERVGLDPKPAGAIPLNLRRQQQREWAWPCPRGRPADPAMDELFSAVDPSSVRSCRPRSSLQSELHKTTCS